jgi:hypothetical protein
MATSDENQPAAKRCPIDTDTLREFSASFFIALQIISAGH